MLHGDGHRSESEILTQQELHDVLTLAVDQKTLGVISFNSNGKWHMANVRLCAITSENLHLELKPEEKISPINIQINQPVGISCQYEFNKYIFETVVIGFESSVNQTHGGRIVLELPKKIERMQRRAYIRIDVPNDLNIKVLFWHRGYVDDSQEVPLENYWQGKLIDLGAGGMQIGIDLEEGPNFRVGQLIGLQFTPMSYEKPMLLEAQVKHLAENAEDKKLYVGVEFIGLEGSGEGRKKLRRLVSIVDEYERQNDLAGRSAESALF